MRIEVASPCSGENLRVANEIADLLTAEGWLPLVRDHDSPTAYADPEYDVVITCKRTER